jgi:hypothetical protein
MKRKTINIDIIREAIANYMYSEGCSCCQGNDHNDHAKKIAELLDVPMYDDESGYNFNLYQTK